MSGDNQKPWHVQVAVLGRDPLRWKFYGAADTEADAAVVKTRGETASQKAKAARSDPDRVTYRVVPRPADGY